MPDSLHKEDSSLSQRISKSMGEETPVGRSKTPVYKFPIHTRRFLFLIQEEATLQDVSENMLHPETLKKSHCPYFFFISFEFHFPHVFNFNASSLETLSKFYNRLSFFLPLSKYVPISFFHFC